MQICISENTHYWEYALLYPRQFRVMTQTESASWSITASKYTIFSWIPIILIFLQGLWTLTLITEVSHWELKLRKILPRNIVNIDNYDNFVRLWEPLWMYCSLLPALFTDSICERALTRFDTFDCQKVVFATLTAWILSFSITQ